MNARRQHLTGWSLYLTLAVAAAAIAWVLLHGGLARGQEARNTEPFATGERAERFRRLMPLPEYAGDARVVYYNEADFPRCYQFDHLGHNSFHLASYNISAEPSERFGNGNREHPWARPAGLDRVPRWRAYGVRFIRLPRDSQGRTKPIVWWQEPSGLVRWRFPRDAAVGEVLVLRCPDGFDRPFEVRIRHRAARAWHMQVLCPYPTADDLAAAIVALEPGYRSDPQLAAAVARLLAPPAGARLTLVDRHPRAALAPVSYQRDELAPLPAELVYRLLARPFQEATGVAWKGTACHAPTTSGFHIVPAGYEAEAIERDDQSCRRCHETVAQSVDDFDRGRDWYGVIRGDDGIFSFHPARRACLSTNGFPRPIELWEVAGLLERRDFARHNRDDYQELLP